MIKNHLQKLYHIGFFHILFSGMLTKALGFFLITLITRILTKHELGVLSYVQSMLNFVSPFVGWGLSYGLFVFLAQEPKYGKLFVKKCFKLATMCNFLLLVFVIVFSFIFPFPFSKARWIFLILFISLIIQSYKNLLISLFRAFKRNDLVGVINGLSSFNTFLIVSTGSYLMKLSGYLFSYLFAQLLNIGLVIFVGFKKVTLNRGLQFQKTRELLFLSLSASGANLLSTILYSVDIFLIGTLLGKAEKTADYFIASVIPSNLLFFSRVILETIQPFIASRYNDRTWLWYVYRKTSLVLLMFNGFIAILLYFLNRELLKLFFGSGYVNISNVFNILLLNFVIVGSFGIVSGNIIGALGLAKYNFLIDAGSAILNISLNIPMILASGIRGAAIATLVANFLNSIVGAIVLKSYCKKECNK